MLIIVAMTHVTEMSNFKTQVNAELYCAAETNNIIVQLQLPNNNRKHAYNCLVTITD